MKIRSENTEVNSQFAELLSKRNDLRIGQMVSNTLKQLIEKRHLAPQVFENMLFYIEDEELIRLIVEMLQ